MKKILLILICLIFVGCSNESENIDNAIVNSNPNIIKEQQVSDLTLNNTFLYYQDGLSTFTVDVINNSDENKTYNIKIIFKNDNNYVLHTLNTTTDIASKETKKISLNTDYDLSKATKVEYSI